MLAPGRTLQGRYTILGTLGQGGMGAVYLAEDARLPGRRCAIKENLPDPNASPQALAQARQQFLNEASILARLDHPNLPKVSDYFTESGREYLVMDYVEGEDLESALRRTGQPLPEKPVLLWADQVLDALEYLHSQRPQPVIHRDIKPANIRLTSQGKVKLVDFGLVKLLDPNDPRTKTALRGLGTPEYAPLEQYAAGAGHTDARSDIYSLGATLYHLLTNTPPPDVHRRMLNPAVLVPPRKLNPQLSENTERAVLRAMEIHPDQRYQTAREMRQALKGTAPPGQTPVQVTPPRPRRRMPVPMVAFGLAMLVIIGLVALFVRPGGGVPRGATATPPAPAVARVATTPARPAPVVTLTATAAPLEVSPTEPPVETPTPGPAGLQQLKDRFGMEFVYVPPGEFLMGSSEADVDTAFELCQQTYGGCYRDLFEAELPQHAVNLDGFWISRTEVTNAQYRPFVEAGGYQQRELWTEAGWAWREENNVIQPGCWDDEKWNQPDYPVVCVSWYEAMAYARWLARETGLEVRLPTEAEWEKAARGTDGRIWPWGNEPPDSSRLNYCDRNCEYDWKDEAVDDGYQYTAPAGSYPAGASPYGALDMAGNVWEWASTLWGGCSSPPGFAYPYRSDDGREELEGSDCRVVRGGAWNDHHVNARPASRDGDYPDDWYDNLGLRVVVVAPR